MSTFDPVMRDLDNYLTRIEDEGQEEAGDLLLSIEWAQDLLGRAERAIKAGDLKAAKDNMQEASDMLGQ